MEAADQMKLAVERAMNNLESFIFEFRDKLEDEDVLKMTSEEEREKIRGKLSATGDWLEEDKGKTFSYGRLARRRWVGSR